MLLLTTNCVLGMLTWYIMLIALVQQSFLYYKLVSPPTDRIFRNALILICLTLSLDTPTLRKDNATIL